MSHWLFRTPSIQVFSYHIAFSGGGNGRKPAGSSSP
jgi:hypothetical protein